MSKVRSFDVRFRLGVEGELKTAKFAIIEAEEVNQFFNRLAFSGIEDGSPVSKEFKPMTVDDVNCIYKNYILDEVKEFLAPKWIDQKEITFDQFIEYLFKLDDYVVALFRSYRRACENDAFPSLVAA